MNSLKLDNPKTINAADKNAVSFANLDNIHDVENISAKHRAKIASDFAIYNSCNVIFRNNQFYGNYRLADLDDNIKYSKSINHAGDISIFGLYAVSCGYCPVIKIAISSKSDLLKLENNFSKFKGLFGRLSNKQPSIKLGAYPQKSVNDYLQDILEHLYNDGNIKLALKPTGKLYTLNSVTETSNVASKLCPEFEYQGNKYVRFHANTTVRMNNQTSNFNKPIWFSVKPVEFVVKNWKQLPKSINPSGKETASQIELQTKDILISGVPFVSNNRSNFNIYNYLNDVIGDMFDSKEQSITQFSIPSDQTEIADFAFEGCTFIDKIKIHKNVEQIGRNAFSGCKIKCAYIEKGTSNLVLSSNFPGKDEEYSHFLNFEKLFSSIPGSNLDIFLDYFLNKDMLDYVEKFNKLSNKLKNAGLTIPYQFINKLEPIKLHDSFFESDFRFIKNEFPDLDEQLKKYPVRVQIAFWKFAYIFGCLSHDEFLDNNGNSTGVFVAQKASSALAKFFKNDLLSIEKIYTLYSSVIDVLPFDNIHSQELIKFLSNQGKNGKFENLELLLDLEKEDKGCFAFILNSFDVAKEMRLKKDKDGKFKALPWKDVFLKMRANIAYQNVTRASLRIAEVFHRKGLDQKVFDEASNLFSKAKIMKVNSHILNKQLKENSLLEEIERIKQKTAGILDQTSVEFKKVFENTFSYEFLDKYDPKNAIIGLYCDCCAQIGNNFYGAEIAKSTILANDVQNLVVKNYKGDIVAKAAMYVNKKYGYIVLNEFEIDKIYKKNETSQSGIYTDDDGVAGKARDAIFNAFLRGINDFVKEYDAQHPKRPIKKVHVGMGYNRLKKQCEMYKTAKKNLQIPEEYGFVDAEQEQKVLYEK